MTEEQFKALLDLIDAIAIQRSHESVGVMGAGGVAYRIALACSEFGMPPMKEPKP